MASANSMTIPNFVSAASPQALRKQMLLNNLKKGFFFRYFDIQFVGGKWFAWYIDSENQELEVLISKG